MNNLEFYSKAKKVPKNAQKKIEAGRIKGFTSINPVWREEKLTEIYGPYGKGWYYETEERMTESPRTDEIIVDVTLKLYVKYPGEKDFCPPAVGFGSTKYVSSERSGLRVDDDARKKAKTDAFGNAAKVLGVGADIYYKSVDDNKYTSSKTPEPVPVKAKAIGPKLKDNEPITTEQIEHLQTLLKKNGKQEENFLGFIAGLRGTGETIKTLDEITYKEYSDNVALMKE